MIREYLKQLFVLVTLGWDFPLIKWWRSRPRVKARIEKRRAALRAVVKPLIWLIKLPYKFVTWQW